MPTDPWIADPQTVVDRLHRPPTKHRNGVPWNAAPLPRRLHRCTPQTWGHIGWFRDVQRCACGAARELGSLGHGWRGRNSRRWAP